MSWLVDLLEFVPKPVQLLLVGGILCVGLAAGHEYRYMTVGQYTKSYILDLKSEIRAIRKEIVETEDPRHKLILEEQLQLLLDDLCYEAPNDPYCDEIDI